MKKKLLFMMSISMLILTLITTILVAFLLDRIIKENIVTVGEVKVGYDIYFTKNDQQFEASEVFIDPNTGLKKSGVYFVNMDTPTSNSYITNLTVDILVDSSVDTYIRVKVHEQLTLKVENYLGEITELSIISPPTEFNTFSNEEISWYYDENSNYYYCTSPVKGIKENDEYLTNRIRFIIPLETGYSPRPLNYSLQVGIEIDAVQYKGGPQNNWNLSVPPWGGNWQWKNY